MADISPEQKEPKSPLEAVKLNQEFQIFKPDKTSIHIIDSSKFSQEEVGTTVALAMENLPLLNFWFKLNSETVTPSELILNPFEPKKGYTITNHDFNREQRQHKITQIVDEYIKKHGTSHPDAIWNVDPEEKKLSGIKPLTFSAWFLDNPEVVSKPDPKLFDLSKEKIEFRPEVLDIIKKLRIHLFFPQSSFEGLPYPFVFGNGQIFFEEFYPIDAPPMANAEYLSSKPKRISYGDSIGGSPISFSNDMEKIQSVRGMFVLDPRTE